MPDKFDHGPTPTWEALFAQAPIAFFQQNDRFRTEFSPVYYRGRVDGTARVLVVGQDPSTDEILAQRTLVGEAGQLVQGLLSKLGVTQSYLMLNTFLFGIRGQFDSTMRQLSRGQPILGYRNQMFSQVSATNTLEAVIAFGNGSHDAIDRWQGAQNLTVFKLVHPTARAGITDNWNQHLPQMRAAIQPDAGAISSATPYDAEFKPQDRADIPRFDLPFGIPDWHGTGGTHSSRGGSRTKITWTR